VCKKLFCYVFKIGKDRWRDRVTDVWNHRKKPNPFPKVISNYNGYRNKNTDPEWEDQFINWLLLTFEIEHSHYTARKHSKYIIYPYKGKQLTMIAVYGLYIKQFQREVYDFYGAEYVHRHNKSLKWTKEEKLRPKPTYRNLNDRQKILWDLAFVPLKMDTCNKCMTLYWLIRDEIDLIEKIKMQKWHEYHLHQARLGYQWNGTVARVAQKSWEGKEIKVGVPPMSVPGTYQAISADFDKDRRELDGPQQKYYNSNSPQYTGFNLHCDPKLPNGLSNTVYAWSKGVGGKCTQHVQHTLRQYFEDHCIGAENLSISHDYQFVNQENLKFWDFLCAVQSF